VRSVQRREAHLELCVAVQVQEKALDNRPTPDPNDSHSVTSNAI